jgi:hypothetical protein
MEGSPEFVRFSLIFVLAASTADAVDCRTTVDNRCFFPPTTAARAVDCQTTVAARCLSHPATDAEIEADARASQRRIEALLQEQHEAAAWGDTDDPQEAEGRVRAEQEGLLFDRDAAPVTFVFFRAPLQRTLRHWSGRR